MRKNLGFTLIEVILVLALLGSATAIAAPNVIDVLDDSKDRADTAQMDFLLNAFQLQQGAYYETHHGEYDMMNPNTTPEQALNAFLKDALTDPDSDVYIADVKRVKTDQIPTAGNMIFKGVASETQIWIECDHPDNASSIKLRIPGKETIDYVYSEGQPERSTWMIIGDDDRLRAEYIQAMMHMSKDQAKKELLKKENGKQFYRYRTTFRIEHQAESDPQVGDGEFWKLFTHNQVSGTQKIGLDPSALSGGEIEYRYRYVQGNHWRGDPYYYKKLMDREVLNVSMGHTKEEAIIEFRNKKDGSGYVKYGVQVMHSKDLPIVPNPAENDASSGWIQTGSSHWFYYEMLAGDATGDGGSSGQGQTGEFTYHTGMIFNYVNENNYDFLSIEQNQSGQMVLRSYRVQGGSASGYKTEKVLSDFQFNETYTMDLRVEKGKAIVNLSGGLLEADAEFSIGNDLHPAIGYYMGEDTDLKGKLASSNDESELPLVQYEAGKSEGPRFIMASMPDFYPYESETTPPQPEKLEPPVLERLGTTHLTINPVEFRISTASDTPQTMVLTMPDGSVEHIDARTKTFSVDQTGTIEAFAEGGGKKSKETAIEVDNIIPPFTEIEGIYRQGYWRTDFELSNYNAVLREMETYQKRETLRLILETGGKKIVIKDASFTLWNSEFDADDFSIYVESVFGEILSPLAKIAQPKPPEIQLEPSDYRGYAWVTMTSQAGETITYRLLDESQSPLTTWEAYYGSFVEIFSYIEARTQNASGVYSESVICENPYSQAIVSPPTITPLSDGSVWVESEGEPQSGITAAEDGTIHIVVEKPSI